MARRRKNNQEQGTKRNLMTVDDYEQQKANSRRSLVSADTYVNKNLGQYTKARPAQSLVRGGNVIDRLLGIDDESIRRRQQRQEQQKQKFGRAMNQHIYNTTHAGQTTPFNTTVGKVRPAGTFTRPGAATVQATGKEKAGATGSTAAGDNRPAMMNSPQEMLALYNRNQQKKQEEAKKQFEKDMQAHIYTQTHETPAELGGTGRLFRGRKYKENRPAVMATDNEIRDRYNAAQEEKKQAFQDWMQQQIFNKAHEGQVPEELQGTAKKLRPGTTGPRYKEENKPAVLQTTEEMQNTANRNYMNRLLRVTNPEMNNYGGIWSAQNQDVKDALRIGAAQWSRNEIDQQRQAGMFDQGDNISLWSPQHLAEMKKKYQDDVANYEAQLEGWKLDERNTDWTKWDKLLDLFTTDGTDELRQAIGGNDSVESANAYQRLQDLMNSERSETDGKTAVERLDDNKEKLLDMLTSGEYTNPDDIHREVYDAINGRGAYEKAVQGMDDGQRTALDEQIDEALKFAYNPNAGIARAQAMLQYSKGRLKAIENEEAWQGKYDAMMETQAEGDTEWHAQTLVGGNWEAGEGDTLLQPVDYVWAALNPDFAKVDDKITGKLESAAMLMNDQERNQFLSLYNAGKKDEAYAFYQGISPMLNQAYNRYETIDWQDFATRHPGIATAGTFAATALQPLEFLANLPEQVAALFGDENATTDPYSNAYTATRFKQAIRQKVAANLGDWGWVYNALTSAGDSALNVAIGKGLGLTGDAAQYGVLGLFGSQAFETSLQQNMAENHGSNFAYDWVEAFIDTAIETATEVWSVENWLQDPTNLLTYVLKIGISEPSEEIAGAIVEPYVKELLGHGNQYEERAQQILVDGGYRDGSGKWIAIEEGDVASAKRQAMREWNHDIRMAAQEALLSVGPAMGYGALQNAAYGRQLNQMGRNVNEYLNPADMQSFMPNNLQQAQQEQEQAAAAQAAAEARQESNMSYGLQQLMNRAKNSAKESEAAKAAAEIEKAQADGKKIKNKQIGKLAAALLNENGTKARELGRQAMEEKVKELLGEKTENAAEKAKLTAQALTEGLDSLTGKERRQLQKDAATAKILQEARAKGTNETKTALKEAVQEATKDLQEERKSINEIALQDNETLNRLRKEYSVKDLGATLATEDDLRRAEGERRNTPDEVIYDGKFARMTGVKDGKVQLDGQGDVDVSDLQTADPNTAFILRQYEDYRGVYTDRFVNKLLQVQGQGTVTDTGRFMMDAERIRISAFTGQDMPATSLPQNIAQDLYNDSLKEAGEMNKAMTHAANFRGVGQGTASFLGVDMADRAAWRKAIKDNHLTKTEQNNMEFVARIARISGFDLRMTTTEELRRQLIAAATTEEQKKKLSAAAEDVHGSENLGGIVLNVDTWNKDLEGNRTTKHNIVVTMGHEMTHWLKANSPSAYYALQQYVMQAQQDAGVDLGRRIEQKIAAYKQGGKNINLAEAIDEIVADSCDQMLGSRQFRDYLQENKPGLFKQVQQFVSSLVDRFNRAMADLTGSASRDAQVLMGRHYNELAKLWLGAYNEALTGKISELEAGQAENDAVNLSVAYNGKVVIDNDLGQNDLLQSHRMFSTWANKYLRQYKMNEELDPKKVIKDLKGAMSESTRQWLHNAYEKYGKKVTRNEIENFIKSDYENLKKNSAAITAGWKELLRENGLKSKNINSTKAEGGNLRSKTRSIADQLFGKKANSKNVWVGDTNTTIRIDSNTLDKSIIYNDEHGVQWKTVEKILRNADKLLEDAKYIGSHQDYTGKPGNVHYYVSEAMLNEMNKETKKEEMVLRPVVFAVHDAINTEQKKLYHGRAYVAEIMAIEKEDNLSPFNTQGNVPATTKALRSAISSNNIIQRVLNSVNAERVRKFDKEALKDKELYLSGNTNFSMNEIDSAYNEALKAGDEARMQEMVDAAAEKAGYTIRGEHGTVSKYFTIFDRSKGNAEGDWGKGFYFTSNSDDVESNYANAAGADITSKIEQLADQMEWMDEYEGTSRDERMEAARKLLAGGEPRIIQAALKMENPVHIGGENETFFDYTEEYDEETDEYGEPEGSFVDLMQALEDVLSDYEWAHADLSRLWEEAEDYQGMDARTFEKLAKEAVQDIEDEDGKLVGHEIVREAFERAGYDGIADHTVAWKFGNRSGRRGGGMEGVNEDTTHYIVFNSEQIKQTDPVTYDDNGDVIPLSERFNDSNPDIRWSMNEANMDVANWMMNQTPSSLQTENERQLVQAYRDLRAKISMSLLRQAEYDKRLKQLEAKPEMNYDERQEYVKLKQKLTVQEDKQARLEHELYEVTSDEGYAGMMYKQQQVYRDFVQGKTQAQVEAAVDRMQEEAERAAERIKKQTKKLEEMADNTPIKVIKKALASRGLAEAVKTIRSEFSTTMSAEELNSRMAEIVLKVVNGEDIAQDISWLAEDIIRRQANFQAEEQRDILKQMRGMTVVIGPEQQTELKASNHDIKWIRDETDGSGVKFVYGDKASLDDIEELAQQFPAMRAALDNTNQDQLFSLVGYIKDLLQSQTNNENQLGIDPDQVEAYLWRMASIMTDDDLGGLSREKLMNRIKNSEGPVEKALNAVKETLGSAEKLLATAKKATEWTGILSSDVQAAIDYYNETAKQAAQVERQKVREGLIQTLKDEHTRELIEQQQKYEELIKKDKDARKLALDNETARKKIQTVVSRFKKLLTQETDQKNIPEEAKPLARIVSKMIAEHDFIGYRHVMTASLQQLKDFIKRLEMMDAANGAFDPESDLDWLVIRTADPTENDTSIRDKVIDDLQAIESGLLEYRTAEGQGLVTLQDRNNALNKIQKAVSEIADVIKARSEAEINGRKWQVYELAETMEADMKKSRFKGERVGLGANARNSFSKAVGYGNMTPEYFFKALKNRAMTLLHKGLQEAEQRAGLEALKAQGVVEKIAKETGFANWDGQEIHKVEVAGGKTVDMTTEQVMALYATWQREHAQIRPEETAHLLKSGFVLAQNQKNTGLPGRERQKIRPVRITWNQLQKLGSYLTPEQLDYVNRIVAYMSSDLAELGNEASLKAYGIRKFTEQYYFPIKSWSGVLNSRSDTGTPNANENRAMRQSFTKRITDKANNAIEISDFTPTAMKHIVGMINFNTMGPAVENLNKVLNTQITHDAKNAEEAYKRNLRAAFQEAYGKNAAEYLQQFMLDVNGGVNRQAERSLKERLLSVFRKGAVAGSLSVAAQQPLSYIRAAMMISPKYLAAAINPLHWGKVHDELLQYSGLAVIKDMGRFDMGQGQSMVDFITPDGLESKGRKAWEWVSDKATVLPEKMDQLTWGRMWVACKLETAAKNPGMDTTSETFLKKAAERFNDVVRRTQVYDSVMVKSQNMRSKNYAVKAMTSFMAEPTLSLNVLADAVQNVKEKGGKANLANAAATFLLSAAAQAAVKALMASGRNPDDKKTWEEQFLTRWFSNFMSEANPFSLIPGYSDMVEVLKKGELKDDAMGVLGKIKTIYETTAKWVKGDSTDLYRNLEDTAGQVVQLFTNIPAKNILRDTRAMINWFKAGTYADRETNAGVLKYGVLDALHSGDNMLGVINSYLGLAGTGYKSGVNDYAKRIYNAQKAGNEQAAKDMTDYYVLAKSNAENPKEQLAKALNTLAKADDSLTAEEKAEKLHEGGYGSMGKFIMDQYKAGEIDRKTAEELYRKENPNAKDKDVAENFGRIDWEKAGRTPADGQKEYTNYTPLLVALQENSAEAIRDAAADLKSIGYEAKDIKKKVNEQIKKLYLAADKDGRVKLQDAMNKAYKALGYSAEDAAKTRKGWKAED